MTALCVADPRLVAVAERAGELPLRLHPPGFAGLARIVVGQMVSRASAEAIWRRLEAHAGEVTACVCARAQRRRVPGDRSVAGKGSDLEGAGRRRN